MHVRKGPHFEVQGAGVGKAEVQMEERRKKLGRVTGTVHKEIFRLCLKISILP